MAPRKIYVKGGSAGKNVRPRNESDKIPQEEREGADADVQDARVTTAERLPYNISRR